MNRLEQLLDLLKESPEDVFLQYALGMEYYSCGNIPKAKEQFLHVLNLQPLHHDAMFRLAQIEEEQGKENAAMEWYQKALQAAQQNKDYKTAKEIQNILQNLSL
jgi:tetratricopeptide (TPR) repeat protein